MNCIKENEKSNIMTYLVGGLVTENLASLFIKMLNFSHE